MSLAAAISTAGGYSGHGSPAVGRIPAVGATHDESRSPDRHGATATNDSVSISAAALQYQLGEVRSQIQRISSSCSLCDPTRVTVLAPLYAKAEMLQSLIAAANAS